MGNFCGNCGSNVAPDQRFCHKCGAGLEENDLTHPGCVIPPSGSPNSGKRFFLLVGSILVGCAVLIYILVLVLGGLPGLGSGAPHSTNEGTSSALKDSADDKNLMPGDSFTVSGVVQYSSEPSDIGEEYCFIEGNETITYSYLDIGGEENLWQSNTFYTRGEDTACLKNYVGQNVTVSGHLETEIHGIPYIANVQVGEATQNAFGENHTETPTHEMTAEEFIEMTKGVWYNNTDYSGEIISIDHDFVATGRYCSEFDRDGRIVGVTKIDGGYEVTMYYPETDWYGTILEATESTMIMRSTDNFQDTLLLGDEDPITYHYAGLTLEDLSKHFSY